MRRHVTLWVWLIILLLATFWASGLAIGWSLGIANADPYQCSGYSGPFFSQSNCGGQQCTSVNIFGFWSSQCTPVYQPPPEPLP